MGEFPMFRLATLLARQVSSPVASRIKDYASKHPWFSRRVVAAGQLHHAAQLRFRLWVLALPPPQQVPLLSTAAALEAGGNILGEVLVFFLGSLIIIFEVNRQAVNKEGKELAKESEWIAVLLQLQELQRELGLQQQDIERLLAELRTVAPPIVPHVPRPPPAPPDLPPPI